PSAQRGGTSTTSSARPRCRRARRSRPSSHSSCSVWSASSPASASAAAPPEAHGQEPRHRRVAGQGQDARQVPRAELPGEGLDRLVGYKLSPLPWDKVRRGLSAGRVQSVAVRIICEREREIRAFTPEEYWTVEARLEAGEPPPFAARLAEVGGQKLDHKSFRLDTKARVDEVLAGLAGADWTVTKVERKERRRHPTPPFITSRLQQEASRKLGFQP